MKLTALTELIGIADNDWLYVVDVSDTTHGPAGTSKKIQKQNLTAGIPATSLAVTGLTASRLLRVNAAGTAIESANVSVATLTAAQLLQADGTGAIIQSSGKTAPAGAIVGTTDIQTLTNKTLTSSTLEGENNTNLLRQKDSGGTSRNLLRLGADNRFYVGGTGISKIVLQSEFDGWVSANETWTYASATTFTVAGDLTSRYTAGTKIKLTQNSTEKYFSVVSSSYSAPNTTVTITGGTSFSFTNHAITENFYSSAENPFGFPSFFAYTPSFAAGGGGASLGNGVLAGRFTLRNRQVRGMLYFEVGSTTNLGTGALLWGLPLTGATHTFQGDWARLGLAQTGVNNNTLGVANFHGSSRTELAVNSYTGTGLWQTGVPGTWSTGSQAWLYFEYEI